MTPIIVLVTLRASPPRGVYSKVYLSFLAHGLQNRPGLYRSPHCALLRYIQYIMDPLLNEWLTRWKNSYSAADDLVDAKMFFSLTRKRKSVPIHGGSRPGKNPNKNRDFQQGYQRIFQDYFAQNAVYDDKLFRRRFRMRRELFIRIMKSIELHDPWFEQKTNALGEKGLFPLQKMVAALRILAYGSSYDMVDEYIRISESSSSECLQHFCSAMESRFGEEYLRSPTSDDLKRILNENSARGFPGMIGSIDCYNWKWENCPKAWHGSYRGVKGTSIVLEAAVSRDLWFWHAFFGMPGSMNDINVLQRSPLLHSLISGTMPQIHYTVNGNLYDKPYWLADGIYPNWPVFVKTIPDPQGAAKQYFAKQQEACRKDVERAFGVLQKRFAIVRNPSRMWHKEKISSVMRTCIILHNMIVEDEREIQEEQFTDESFEKGRRRADRRCRNSTREPVSIHMNESRFEDLPEFSLSARLIRIHEVRDREKHYQLQADLIENLWRTAGFIE